MEIVIRGVLGEGKKTLAAMLYVFLRRFGYDVQARDPKTDIVRLSRELPLGVLDGGGRTVVLRTEFTDPSVINMDMNAILSKIPENEFVTIEKIQKDCGFDHPMERIRTGNMAAINGVLIDLEHNGLIERSSYANGETSVKIYRRVVNKRVGIGG